jgi:predicted deacylase
VLLIIFRDVIVLGPTLLLTGNIHGDEVTGVIVIHRFLESLDLSKLRGRIVAVPSLNPTGLLAETRFPQFEAKDPNRAWPDSRPEKEEKDENPDLWKEYSKRVEDEKGPQARAFAKIAKIFEKINPQFHLDLHTFSILSHPFAFVDRVLYTGTNNATINPKLNPRTTRT